MDTFNIAEGQNPELTYLLILLEFTGRILFAI